MVPPLRPQLDAAAVLQPQPVAASLFPRHRQAGLPPDALHQRVLLLERLQALRVLDLDPPVLLAPAEVRGVRGVRDPSSLHTADTVFSSASWTPACRSLLAISSAVIRLAGLT